MSRFKVVNRSLSNHCCFSHSVLDTGKKADYAGIDSDSEVMCECFDEESAQMICDALNKFAPTKEPA